MADYTLNIDGKQITVKAGASVRHAAIEAGIYIPGLCDHPDLTPVGYCGLCVVDIEGKGEVLSCQTQAVGGMIIKTDTESVKSKRRAALEKIIVEHPHACLECWRKERCPPDYICLRTSAVAFRCVTCPKNGHCELQRVVDFVGISADIPYKSRGEEVISDNPFFYRDYNQCIVCGRCVRVCRDVRGIGVYKLDDEKNPTKVSTVKGSVIDSGCKSCFACVEVCPTGAIVDVDFDKYCQDRDAYVVPCSNACPAHIDIPSYVNYIKQGKYSESLAVIREKVPFPGSLGRVCVHPCEQACRRGIYNHPISIKELKRVAADRGTDLWKKNSKKKASTGKKVAVVGGGPAGLTGAFYLAKAGHAVTIFEALPKSGGMMRYGIPEYRLPRNILDGEIDIIREAGVEIVYNTRIESLDDLTKQGYDAILLGVGAHGDSKMGIEGEGTPGVMGAATFLREVNLGKDLKPGRRVAVIGGGNSAMDSCRVALRKGAKEVTLIYRRTRAEMPASPEEIEDAICEGVELMFLAAPSKVTRVGDVLKLECIRMKLGKPDASGRRQPEPVPGSEFTTDFDTVIAAIGQAPVVPAGFGLKTGRGNTIQVNANTLQSPKKNIFAAGDAVTGPASVIKAIAAGRQAAISIDKYLGGTGEIEENLVARDENGVLGKEESFADRVRQEPSGIPMEGRFSGFTEVKYALSPEHAAKEAGRCYRCDLRLKLTPAPQPPVTKKELALANEG